MTIWTTKKNRTETDRRQCGSFSFHNQREPSLEFERAGLAGLVLNQGKEAPIQFEQLVGRCGGIVNMTDRLANRLDFFSRIIRNVDVEFFFQLHY